MLLQVGFNSSRFAICFNGQFTPGIQNDCILTSGGTADRGALAVLTKEIPSGSGIHKMLPNLGNTGKCVNVIRLKNSLDDQVRVICLFHLFTSFNTHANVTAPVFCVCFFYQQFNFRVVISMSLDWANWTGQLWSTSNFCHKDIPRVHTCWCGT